MLPRLKFSETVSTLLSYVIVVAITAALIVFGMRVERHLIKLDCDNDNHMIVERTEYICYKEQ